jgi:hypothetical protein
VSDALGRDRGVVDRRHFVVVFSRDHGAPFMLLSLTTALGKSGSSRKTCSISTAADRELRINEGDRFVTMPWSWWAVPGPRAEHDVLPRAPEE